MSDELSRKRRARVLVTDDEPHVRSAVARSLTLSGYLTNEAASGEEALEMLGQGSFDAIILDLRMPGIDGVQVMRHVRQAYPDLLVIILTGHATIESAIAAVKLGAADYLLKPASVHDIADVVAQALEQRAQALRRETLKTVHKVLDELETPIARPTDSTESVPRLLRAGNVTLDIDKNVALVRGKQQRTCTFTNSETILLACLMEQAGQAVPFTELATALGYGHLGRTEARDLVRPHISRLRRKMGEAPRSPKLIQTVRGIGYIFNP